MAYLKVNREELKKHHVDIMKPLIPADVRQTKLIEKMAKPVQPHDLRRENDRRNYEKINGKPMTEGPSFRWLIDHPEIPVI